MADEKLHQCSFCSKSQDEVKKIIAGPNVYICNECIDLCNEILNQHTQDDQLDSAEVHLTLSLIHI